MRDDRSTIKIYRAAGGPSRTGHNPNAEVRMQNAEVFKCSSVLIRPLAEQRLGAPGWSEPDGVRAGRAAGVIAISECGVRSKSGRRILNRSRMRHTVHSLFIDSVYNVHYSVFGLAIANHGFAVCSLT